MSRRVCEKPLVLKARWRRKMIKGIKTHSAGPAEHMVPPTPPHTLTFDKCINPISNQGGLLPFLKHRKSCEIVRADRTIFGSAENVCNFAKRILLFSDFFHAFMGKKVENYGRLISSCSLCYHAYRICGLHTHTYWATKKPLTLTNALYFIVFCTL